MSIDNNEKSTPKRLNLKNNKVSRESFARIMRLYWNNDIGDTKFKNLVYSFSKLLEYDKHAFDTEITKRLDALELRLNGGSSTIIDAKELDNPYTADLKRRLAETEQLKSNLQQRLIEMDQELKQIKAQMNE